jgi:hypothetical protein
MVEGLVGVLDAEEVMEEDTVEVTGWDMGMGILFILHM